MFALKVNGEEHEVDISPDMPLLWTLLDEIGLTGTSNRSLPIRLS